MLTILWWLLSSDFSNLCPDWLLIIPGSNILDTCTLFFHKKKRVDTVGLRLSTFLFDLDLLAPSSCFFFFFSFKTLLMAHTNCTDTDAESQIYTYMLIPSSSSRVQRQNVENLLWISLFSLHSSGNIQKLLFSPVIKTWKNKTKHWTKSQESNSSRGLTCTREIYSLIDLIFYRNKIISALQPLKLL